jgi:hypothetical protein
VDPLGKGSPFAFRLAFSPAVLVLGLAPHHPPQQEAARGKADECHETRHEEFHWCFSLVGQTARAQVDAVARASRIPRVDKAVELPGDA